MPKAPAIAMATLFMTASCATTLRAQPSPELVNGLAWRCIGPAAMGGRVDDVAVVETDPATAYVATATAGVWKTTNHGTTFLPVFDDQPCQSVGAVAVSQTNPNIVWVGTGEANNRQSSSWGCGVFKSEDAGATWKHMGLADTLHIARIVPDPRNPDTVFVAAVGHLWGANEQRGLFRTTDGGKTWRAVLQVNADTGCTDVALDPQNSSTVYAAMYQRRRAAWGFVGGGPGSGIYRSRDGGETWTRLENGLPSGDKGRIGLDVYRKDARIVYAVVEARDGGVYRSDDGGDTWRRMSGTNPRPMYFSLIRVDPNNDQFVWLAGVSFLRSRDGGKTFAAEPGARLHADIHAIWINPADSRHMLVGCDGGIQWSHDRGRTWDHYNTIPLAQLYAVAFDMQRPYNVAGGLQDNGSWMGPSSRPGSAGPTNGDWVNIGGGDGFYCALDWTDPTSGYSESQNGALRRVNLATGAAKTIAPTAPSGEPRYRWDWCTPFMLSPHNPRKLILGGNRVFVSTDRGDTWRRTADLSTSPTLSELVIMGVRRGSGYPFADIGSDYGQVVTVTESPVKAGVIYAGTDDGNLQVSRDDGRTWKNVVGNVPGVPRGTYVSRVHASPHSAGRVYACFDGHRSDDYTPYIVVSEDFGETWRPIASGIPQGSAVNVVRDHPHAPNLLFAGTDRGLYVSTDRGLGWTRFGRPLPPLRVDEVLVHPRDNDLIVATHARGVYILDDIALLAAEATGRPSTMDLLPPRPAVMFRTGFSMGSLTGNRQFVTRGAPVGAQIRYWLPEEPKPDDQVILRIETRRGKPVATRRLASASAGYNVTTWDFRADPPRTASQSIRPGSRPLERTAPTGGRQGRSTAAGTARQSRSRVTRGARVPPGDYVVRLTLGDRETTESLRVDPDPRIKLSPRESGVVFEMAQRLLQRAAQLQDADHLAASHERAAAKLLEPASAQSLPPPARALVSSLLADVRAVRARLSGRVPGSEPRTAEGPGTLGSSGQVIRLPGRPPVTPAYAMSRYASTLDALPEMPSSGLRAEIRAADKEADALISEVRALTGRRLQALNKRLTLEKLPVLSLDRPDTSDDEADLADEEAADDRGERSELADG